MLVNKFIHVIVDSIEGKILTLGGSKVSELATRYTYFQLLISW